MGKKTLTQSTVATNNIQSQPDQVKDQAAALKLSFDQYGIDSKQYNNVTLLPELQDSSSGVAGAYAIGFDDVAYGDNVGDALKTIISGGSGSIPPDGTITKPKLASDVLALLQGWIRPVSDNTLRIDELAVNAGVTSITGPNSEIYYDYVGSGKNFTAGIVDRTKAYCETVTTGATSANVTSMIDGVITDYKTGMQVTIQDDNGKESILVDSVADPVINFKSQIQGTYSAGANVYRSNLTDDWEFGGFPSQETIDVTTPEQVINSADSTQGNGGRKASYNGGDIYSLIKGSDNTLKLLKRGSTTPIWTSLAYNPNGWTMFTTENKIHIFFERNDVNIDYRRLDLSGNEEVATLIFTTGTGMGSELSVEPNSDLTEGTVSFNAKVSDYTNSFNVFAIQFTISNDVLTFGSLKQLTTVNTASIQYTGISVVYNNNDYPVITFCGGNLTRRLVYNGSTWSLGTIFDGGSYIQSNTSSTFMPPSVSTKINALWTSGTENVAWQGYGATHTSTFHIFFSRSINSGSNWLSNPVDVAIGERPSLSWSNDGKLHLQYERSGNKHFRTSTDGGDTWSAESSGVVGTNANSVNNYHNFTQAITISMGSGNVQLDGEWTVGTEVALTDIDIRVNIEAFTDKTEISAFLETNDFDTVTLDGFLSIHADGADEDYIDTTDVKIDEGTNNMYLSTGSVVTPQDKATMKYQLTRASTSDTVTIKRVQGGLL